MGQERAAKKEGEKAARGANVSAGPGGGSSGARLQVAHHQVFQKRQLSVKEMPATGDDCDRQYLGPRPVHHRGQRHGVVLLAMHHQRAQVRLGRHRGHVKRLAPCPPARRLVTRALRPQRASAWLVTKAPNENPASAIAPPLGATCSTTASRSCSSPRPSSCTPGAGAHAAKVEAHRRPAALHKGARQGLHHLVVHGAAKQRVGVGNHGDAARRAPSARVGIAHAPQWRRRAGRVRRSVWAFTDLLSIQ
jgi:hypothetical protein